MKMLGFMDLGEAYDSLTTADYGDSKSVEMPSGLHNTHWWKFSPERGHFCLGCHALATWPIARSVCPLRYRPPTELTAEQRAWVREELDRGRRPGDIARELGCYVELVQRIRWAGERRERRRRRKR